MQGHIHLKLEVFVNNIFILGFVVVVVASLYFCKSSAYFSSVMTSTMACNSDASLQHAFLDAAKAFDWDEVWRMLENDPQLVIAQPMGRWSALHQAAFEPNELVVGRLLDLKADVDAVTGSGFSVDAVACQNAPDRLADCHRIKSILHEARLLNVTALMPACTCKGLTSKEEDTNSSDSTFVVITQDNCDMYDVEPTATEPSAGSNVNSSAQA